MWSNILWIWVCPYIHTDSGSDTSTLLIVSKNKTQIIPTCDPSLREQRKESGLCGTKCKCNEQQLNPCITSKKPLQSRALFLNQNGQMGRTCQLWCPISGTKLWQCKATPPIRSGVGGRENQESDPNWCLSQNWHIRGVTHPTPPFMHSSCCYFHISMLHTTTAQPVHNVKEAAPESGTVFKSKWPDGSHLSAMVSNFRNQTLTVQSHTHMSHLANDLPTCGSARWLRGAGCTWWALWTVAAPKTFSAFRGVFW